MLPFNDFRTTLQGTPDLLNYAALVAPGVVLLKDGGFLAGWAYQGEDRESATAQELAVLSARVNTVLTRLGTGWMLHVEAVRQEATDYPPTGAFPDRTTLTLDQARREHYQAEGAHYVSTSTLWLTWWPPEDYQGPRRGAVSGGSGSARRRPALGGFSGELSRMGRRAGRDAAVASA